MKGRFTSTDANSLFRKPPATVNVQWFVLTLILFVAIDYFTVRLV